MAEEHKFDTRLAEGVAYFEQMLQIMPDDRTTLEFLVVAYDQLGRGEDCQKTLISLVKLLVKERDVAALEGLLPRLEACNSAEARALVLKVHTLIAPAPDLTPERPVAATQAELAAEISSVAVESEASLVGLLASAGVLGEEESKRAEEMVRASPADGRVFLISALQILEKENLTLAEKCAAHLADAYGTPPIPLSAFNPPPELVAKFPSLLLRIRGVVPFASFGKHALVALLNPADDRLKAELNGVMPCRFYLADPSAVESALAAAFSESEVAA